MNTFSEADHPRTPTGEFATKHQGVNGSSGVSLEPTRTHLSIDDPEFAAMTGPIPHLDGAKIEFSDGREGTIWVSRPSGRQRFAQAYVTDSFGRRMSVSSVEHTPYRITSWDGDEQRLDDEFTYVRLRRVHEEALDVACEAQGRLGQCFPEADHLLLLASRWTDDGEYTVPYEWVPSPPSTGEFSYNPQTRTVSGFEEDSPSQLAVRIHDLMSTPEFMDAADDVHFALNALKDTQASLDAHNEHLYRTYR